MIIHKHSGDNTDDAIRLMPSEQFGFVPTASSSKIFRIDTDMPDNGSAQLLQFCADDFGSRNQSVSLSLYNRDKALVDYKVVSPSDPCLTRNSVEDNLKTYYLDVGVKDLVATPLLVAWYTNLTVLYSSPEQPLSIRAGDTTEGGLGNDDDIEGFSITVDELPKINTGGLDDFDDEQVRTLVDKLPQPIRFMSQIRFDLTEDDPDVCVPLVGCISDDDHMSGVLMPLERQISQDYRAVSVSGDGGRYPINVTLRHGINSALPIFSPLKGHYFLPLVSFNSGPDLKITNVECSTTSCIVTLINDGSVTVSSPCWVDLYVQPSPVPTGVNQIWSDGRSDNGAVWGVTQSIEPGQAITLTIGGPYYRADLSDFGGPWPANTPIYVQVDSANTSTNYGNVLEVHEITGEAYNNIFGPIYPTSTLSINNHFELDKFPAEVANGLSLPPRPSSNR